MFINAIKRLKLHVYLTVFKLKRGFDSPILKQLKVLSVDNGGCVATFTVNNDNCNEIGGLSNGFATTIVDTITSLGLSTVLNNKLHVTVTINMRYLQPVEIGDEITLITGVEKIGSKLAFLNAKMENNKTGEIVAKATHIKYIMNLSYF